VSAPGRTITLLAAVTIVAAGCALQSQRRAGAPHPSTTARGMPSPAAIIIDADPYGAIVFDEQGRYVGVRRDGTVAWREPAGARAFGVVSCLSHCPDAVLSASLDAINSADVADPPPRLVVDGRWRRLARLDGHKRRILTASGVDQFMLATGDRKRWWLEVHDNGAAARRVRVGGFNSSWQESADGRHGFAVTSAPGGNQARWFTRADDGWRQAGKTMPVAGLSSCVAPDGRRALLLGQRPVVLDRDGGQRPWTDLESAGACAWAATGGIVAELAQTTRGPRSRLRAFDAGGVVRWRLDVADEASVTADPTSSRVAYLVDRVLREIDPIPGVELRSIPRVQAARYDANGELVTITDDGSTTWQR
jgi:hypothetical protein